MNERVREFMAKAGTDTSGKWMGVDNAEKFAELIVKECSAYVEGTGNWLVAMEMKQHFGVEE